MIWTGLFWNVQAEATDRANGLAPPRLWRPYTGDLSYSRLSDQQVSDAG